MIIVAILVAFFVPITGNDTFQVFIIFAENVFNLLGNEKIETVKMMFYENIWLFKEGINNVPCVMRPVKVGLFIGSDNNLSV